MLSRWLQPFVNAWNLYADFTTVVLIFTAVTSFVIGVRMRREIKRALGRKATDEDLADLDTWIEVKEAEEKAGGNNPEESK